MSCTASSNPLNTQAFSIESAQNSVFDQDITPPDGRVLVVSNCPEEFRTVGANSFASAGPVTLHKASISLVGGQTKKVRLWFWHLNEVPDATITIKILVSHGGQAPAQVSMTNIKYQFEFATFNTTEVSDVGQCLAVAQMKREYQTNDNQTVTQNEFSINSPLHQFPLPPHELVGGVIEFDLHCTQNIAFRIRVVASRTADFGSWGTAVWPENSISDPGSPHIRGTWAQSNYMASSSVAPFSLFDSQPSGFPPLPGPDDARTYLVLESNGVHYANNGRYSANQGGPDATDNKGLYGVDVTLKTRVANDTNIALPLFHGLSPRCSGPPTSPRGRFWGAANTDAGGGGGFPYSGTACRVPRLRFMGVCAGGGTVEPGDVGYAEFPSLAINPTNGPLDVKYFLVTGGASNLPITLGQARLQLAESGGPG